MYSSRSDNSLFNTFYEQYDNNQQTFFMMPKGSTLIFPLPDNSQKTHFAVAELKIPKAWTGVVKMSLIPYNYSGNAEIEFQNKLMTSDDRNWSESIAASEKFVDEIDIRKNSNGVVLRYYINPYLYRPEKNNSIKLVGEGVECLEISSKIFNLDQQPDWDDLCDENFVSWLHYLALYSELGEFKVECVDDYVAKINWIEKKGAFAKFNIDSKMFYNQLHKESGKYNHENNEFWQQLEDENNFVHSLMIIIKGIEHVAK